MQVKKHKAERHARGSSRLGQFVAMLFCQLGRAHPLREICGDLACCEGKLKHLGIPLAPKKSTLAHANGHRPWELHQTAFTELLEKCRQEVAGQGGRKKANPPGRRVVPAGRAARRRQITLAPFWKPLHPNQREAAGQASWASSGRVSTGSPKPT